MPAPRDPQVAPQIQVECPNIGCTESGKKKVTPAGHILAPGVLALADLRCAFCGSGLVTFDQQVEDNNTGLDVVRFADTPGAGVNGR